MQYLGLPKLVSVVLAMVVCTALGIVIEGLAYKPLRKAPSLAVLITAIGVSYFLQNSALLIWGSAPKSYPSVISLGSLTLMDGQLVIMGGMINQTNYFDANTYANTTFGQFGGAPFVNNQVLPLGDSNFGFVGQYQFNENWFIQVGGNMMDNEPRRNPFHHTTGKSFNLLGEIGWTHEKAFGIGTGTYRLQPFMFHADGKNHGGVAFNLEQDLGSSPFALFARAGWSSAESGNICGAEAQASAGVIFKKPLEVMTGLKEADGNFFGVGFSVSKPDADTLAETRPGHDREMILECTYSFSITPYCLIQPSYQYVKNPSGRDDVNSANIFSVQCVVTF